MRREVAIRPAHPAHPPPRSRAGIRAVRRSCKASATLPCRQAPVPAGGGVSVRGQTMRDGASSDRPSRPRLVAGARVRLPSPVQLAADLRAGRTSTLAARHRRRGDPASACGRRAQTALAPGAPSPAPPDASSRHRAEGRGHARPAEPAPPWNGACWSPPGMPGPPHHPSSSSRRRVSSRCGTLGLWSKLSEIAGQAQDEALRCSRVLPLLDLARARACRALARRADLLAASLLELRCRPLDPEERDAESRELESILQEASRLALGAPPPPPPRRLSDASGAPSPGR